MSNFSLYKAQYKTHRINSIVRSLNAAKDSVQKMLMSFAHSVECGNADQITHLLHQLGEIDKNNDLIINTDGQQIAKYMRDHLPIKWDRKGNKVVLTEWKTWDYDTAYSKMVLVRWDQYKKPAKSAESAFNGDKELKAIVSKLKATIKKAEAANDAATVRKLGGMLRSIGESVA